MALGEGGSPFSSGSEDAELQGELKTPSATATAGATNAREWWDYGRIGDPIGNWNSECNQRS